MATTHMGVANLLAKKFGGEVHTSPFGPMVVACPEKKWIYFFSGRFEDPWIKGGCVTITGALPHGVDATVPAAVLLASASLLDAAMTDTVAVAAVAAVEAAAAHAAEAAARYAAAREADREADRQEMAAREADREAAEAAGAAEFGLTVDEYRQISPYEINARRALMGHHAANASRRERRERW